MLCCTLLAEVARRYGLASVRDAGTLSGGEWNQVHRIETETGPLVLRIAHPATRPESAAYELALMRLMHREIPQVPLPLPTDDGRDFWIWEDRIVSLCPLMPGRVADRESAGLQAEAAAMLARLHRVALECSSSGPHPHYEPLREVSWKRNLWFDWTAVRKYLASGRVEEALDGLGVEDGRELCRRFNCLDEERQAAEAWVQRVAGSQRRLHFAPVHGDYYRGNVLAEGARITAVIDWEEAHPEWLVFELASALYEFCKDDERCTLERARATAFLQAYREAAGPVPPSDDDLLLPFIRVIRLIEVLFSLDQARQGQPWDPAYTLGNLRALENLHGT